MQSSSMFGADFQSPKRKRKGSGNLPKKSVVARKISESPVPMEILAASMLMGGGDDAETADRDGCSSGSRSDSAMGSSTYGEKSTAKAVYKGGDYPETDTTKAGHGFELYRTHTQQQHLTSAFPTSVVESPFVVPNKGEQLTPRTIRLNRMSQSVNDSSVSSISISVTSSPPTYLLDGGVDEWFRPEEAGGHPATPIDRLVQSFDDVPSPGVGIISMIESPPDRHHAPLSSDSLRMSSSALSPRRLAPPSPVGDAAGINSKYLRTATKFASGPLSPPRSPRSGVRQVGSQGRRGPLFAKDDNDETGVWAGDSSGVACRMSTLNVNKHGGSRDSDMTASDPFRRREGGGGYTSPSVRMDSSSPIMSNHTAFMDLLNAAGDSNPPHGIDFSASVRKAPLKPSVSMGAFHASLPTPSGFAIPRSTVETDVRSSFGTPSKRSKLQGTPRSTFVTSLRGVATSPARAMEGPLMGPSGFSADITTSPSVISKELFAPATVQVNMKGRDSPRTLCESPKFGFDSFSKNRLNFTPDSASSHGSTGSTIRSVGNVSTNASYNTYSTEPPANSKRSDSGRSTMLFDSISDVADVSRQLNSSHSSHALPLPDQSAFDNSVVKQRGRAGNGGKAPSPICPPTPDRTNLHWNMPSGSVMRSIFDDEAIGPAVADDSLDDIPRRPVPLMRMNSLAVSKLLVEGTVELDPCADTEIIFDRDFDNLGVLGSGSFADVYLACRKSPKSFSSSSDAPRRFAIKKNRKKFRGRGDREALLNEVHMMKRAGSSYCPYIVHLVRAWQEDRFFYVQMDIAERGSLRDLLVMYSDKGEAIPDDAIYQVAHDTLMGLAHIHAAGVVHFDIKPANLLISKAGRIMIGDFGLAALVGQPSSDSEGDTRYMAPELLSFSVPQVSSDIFSFGLSIFETCLVPSQASYLPVSGPVWHDLREDRVPSIDTERATRPAALHSLVSASLVSNPDERATASVLLQLPQMLAIKEGAGHSALLSVPLRSTMSDMSRSRSVNATYSSSSSTKTPLSINSSLPPGSNNSEFVENLRTPTAAEQGYMNTPFSFLSSQSAPRR